MKAKEVTKNQPYITDVHFSLKSIKINLDKLFFNNILNASTTVSIYIYKYIFEAHMSLSRTY